MIDVVLGQSIDSMHQTAQYSDEDFLFNNSSMDTELHTLQDSIPLRIMSDYLFRELQVLDTRSFQSITKTTHAWI